MSKYLPEGWTQNKIDDALEFQRKSPNPTNPKQEDENMKHNTERVSMEKATERPWSVIDSMNHIHAFPITNEHGESVGCVYSAETISSDDKASKKLDRQPTAKANAALIVRAVNAYDALVQAVKSCLESQSIVLDMIRNGANLTDIETEQLNGIEISETALKLAKGE